MHDPACVQKIDAGEIGFNMVEADGSVYRSCTHNVPGCDALLEIVVDIVVFDDGIVLTTRRLVCQLDRTIVLSNGTVVAHFVVVDPGIAVLGHQYAVLHCVLDYIVMHIHRRRI